MKKPSHISAFLLLLCLACACSSDREKLVILHLNDLHSHLLADKNESPSLCALSVVIDSIRRAEPNVLLLSGGDNVQGTPFFNIFKGEAEMKALSWLGTEASAVGNHEWDNGPEGLLLMDSLANFPFLLSNYDIDDVQLKQRIKPYLVLERGGLKIGLLALLADIKGIVDVDKASGLHYKDPVATAQYYTDLLRKEMGCDLILCLSHLGYDNPGMNDRILARESEGIDVIIGGHSHTALANGIRLQNKKGREVLIVQTGCYGRYIGKTEIFYRK